MNISRTEGETGTEAPKPASPEQVAQEMAEAVRRIADGTSRILKAGLTKRALVVLLKDACGVPMHEITKVLDGLESLARLYTTKAVRK